MTIAHKPHVTLGGVDFLLDEGTENHFVHALDAFATNAQGGVVGLDGVTNSKSVYWAITDWSGGQGYANWSPQTPWGYYYAYPGVGARERGVLKNQDRLHDYIPGPHNGGTGGSWKTYASWNGRRYKFDGDKIWEYDAFAGCTESNYQNYKREKYWRKVYDRYPSTGTAMGIVKGPNMLVFWGEDNGNSFFIGHGGGYDSEILVSRPIIEMPDEARIVDITYGNGSVWMLGNYGGTGWILEADLSSGQVIPRRKIEPRGTQPAVGDRIQMIYGDIWVGPGYVYDIDYDAVHFVNGEGGTLYTGSYDFGYPFEQKLILGVYAKGAGDIRLVGDNDTFDANVIDGFVKVDPPFSTRRLSMELTPRIENVAVEAIILPNSNLGSGVNEYWYMKLRVKDESEGTELVTSAGTLIPGDTVRDQLWNAVKNNETLTFQNHYAAPHDNITVILDSMQDSVVRSNFEGETLDDGKGEGVCTVIVRRLNA